MLCYYLKDNEVAQFMKRALKNLEQHSKKKKSGLIFIKDNVLPVAYKDAKPDADHFYDESDGSVYRSANKYREIFINSGF